MELHIHFDGAGRRSTLWEAIRRKGGAAAAGLPGDGSLRAFEEAVAVRRPKDLNHHKFPLSVVRVMFWKWLKSPRQRDGSKSTLINDGLRLGR